MKKENELLTEYSKELYSESLGYKMMGILLNQDIVKNALEKFHGRDIYIYGGGSLGVQCYDAIKPYGNVKEVIDINGCLVVPREDISVISLDAFRSRKVDKDIIVIITPIRYLDVIYRDLKSFLPTDSLVHLCELLEKGV